jgi:hypothetical protein
MSRSEECYGAPCATTRKRPMESQSRSRALLRSPGLWSGVLAVAISIAVLVWVHSIGGPTAVRERYGLLAPLISFLTHTVAELVPGGDLVPFGIANGTLYGVALGAAISWLAWMVSAVIHYLVARRTAVDLDLAARLESLPAWLRRGLPDRRALVPDGRSARQRRRGCARRLDAAAALVHGGRRSAGRPRPCRIRCRHAAPALIALRGSAGRGRTPRGSRRRRVPRRLRGAGSVGR